MPKEQDPFRKYVQILEKRKWRCNFCSIVFAGSTPRIRAHLAGIPGKGIKACKEVKDAVRAEALETFNGEGSVLYNSTGGTTGEGTRGTDTQNSNQLGCTPQQGCLPPDDRPLDNLDTSQPSSLLYLSETPAQPDLSTHLEFEGDVLPPPLLNKITPTCISPGIDEEDPGLAEQFANEVLDSLPGTASARPQDQESLSPGDRPRDNLDNTQQSDPSNHWLDAAHGNENASSLQPLSSPYISELPALPELLTQLDFGTVTASACPQYEVSLPREKSTRGTSGEGTEGTDTQNLNQLGFSPQQPSFYLPTGTGTAPACPQEQGSLPPSDRLLDNLDDTQQRDLLNLRSDAARENEIASSFQHLAMGSLASPSLCFSERLVELQTHLELETEQQNARGLSSFPNYEVRGNSRSSGLEEFIGDRITTESPLPPTYCSNLYDSLPENLPESREDCGQPRGVVEVSVPSNRSLTNIVQESGQLPPRCDKEDENDIRRFPSPTQREIDPSSASLHTSDSHISEATIVDSLVVEVSTDTVVPTSSHAMVPPSSSQAPHNAPPPPQILPYGTGVIGPSSLPESDMNKGAPVMSHPNIGNDFEENRALKRKKLFSKEALIRDELEFAASLSLKKPRMEVVNWLANVEKLRNYCTEAAGEDCLPPHQQVDTLMHEVEDFIGQRKGLFEARETRVKELIENKMVGEAFQRNTSEILEYLVGNQKCRLGIYGMGGVGKTTIMVHIQNKLLKEANYGDVLWITVSKDFNTQTLQDAIAEALELDKLPKKDVRKRAAMLYHCFEKRGNSTVILDDVWESFDLKEVGIPIESDGIKLVLTTRSFKVCNQMQCEKMIKIEPLSDIEAESLFFEEFGSKAALNLDRKAVVKSIVKECAGLPLAVITMAKSMRGVTNEFEWADCLEKLRESDMEQTDMEKVLKKLELSYNLLGDHEVQQCFLSCALYPEDELIDKFKLIELFIDQGLIGRLNTREKQYARGLTILNKLEDACLLENHEEKMKMHDLIRDMALHIMSATSIVKARKQLRTIPPEEHWTYDLEKVSLMENYIEEFPLNMSPNCPKLSIFLLNTSLSRDLVIPDSFFKHLWRLKVLDLSGCRLRKLPDSISDLVNLTALLLRGCHKLHRIPHLGKLRSLRKLDISFCVQVKALEGLEMLVNLRYLDMIATRIERLPKGTLGALLNLQYLGVGQVNGEEITKLWALEALICCFDNVDDFNKFVTLVSKRENNPCYYRITMHQKDLGVVKPTGFGVLFRDCERSVNILGSTVSAERESNGSGSGNCILIPQCVRNLKAWCCNSVTNLSDIGPLEKLEELQIRFCSNLRVLCGGQDEEVIDIYDSPTRTPTPLLLRSLKDLEISYCPKLKYLIGHEAKFSLPHLRRIRILYCEEMVGITVAATSPPPYPPPAFPSLKEIEVHGCGKMKRVVEFEWLPHFPNLRRIEVKCCNDVEEIIGGLSSYMSGEEISSKWLLVERCHELPFHLQNRQTMQVIGSEGMAELISGAGQGQGSMTTLVNNTPSSSQSSIPLLELNSLYLDSLPQLKSLCEVPITCNSMKNLVVIGCPELNRIPMELQLRDIEDLPYIEVEGEEKWNTLIWDHPDAQANLRSHLLFSGNHCILKGGHNSPFVDGLVIITNNYANFATAWADNVVALAASVAFVANIAAVVDTAAATSVIDIAAIVDTAAVAAIIDIAAIVDTADTVADTAAAVVNAAVDAAAADYIAAAADAFAAFADAFAAFADAFAKAFFATFTAFASAVATITAATDTTADAVTVAYNTAAADFIAALDPAAVAAIDFANVAANFAAAAGATTLTHALIDALEALFNAKITFTNAYAAANATAAAAANATAAAAAAANAFCGKGGDQILSLKAIAL